MEPIKVSRISQFEKNIQGEAKGVYSGLWQFKQFRKALKFTHREPINYNVFTNSVASNIGKKYPEFNNDYYQRLINDDKTKKVINFIIDELNEAYNNNKYGLIPFPTSLILSAYISSATSLTDYEESLIAPEDDSYNEKLGVYLEDDRLYLPDLNVVLIVDGQHRLAGLLCVYNAINILVEGGSSSNDISTKLIDYARKK